MGVCVCGGGEERGRGGRGGGGGFYRAIDRRMRNDPDALHACIELRQCCRQHHPKNTCHLVASDQKSHTDT